VGSVSFSGSILAYLKLDGKVKDKHVMLPKHQWINIVLFLVSIFFLIYTYFNPSTLMILVSLGVCLIYGFSFVAPIGGADMPVVISLLNSITGISAASAGYLYGNQIMILGGILVGASGTILTVLMCQAMNRSLANVIIGGFTATGGSAAGGSGDQIVKEASPMDAAILLNYSQKVMVVPGYGMAVAQAQKQAKELDEILGKNDVEVLYGIHPVAGRMPGHMNVLLAEVDIDYDKLLDLEEANSNLSDTDVVLVVGANDVVNPSAVDDPGSSIYGMPVIEVWNSKQVIVFKRSMNPGYAGIQNPLFFKENTKMLFGDASASLKKIIEEIKTL
jgi:NAD(P) transhydrogenase subunit beta